jgi:uncharacterized protein (TIGR00369 family)
MTTPYSIHPDILLKYKHNQFSHTLGLQLLHAFGGECLVSMPVSDMHLQNVGFVHGGVIATLADVAMGLGASSALTVGMHVLTGDLKISYLNPATLPTLFAVGQMIKQGRTLIFMEGEVYAEGESGKVIIARASATMVIVSREDIELRRQEPKTS